MNNFAEKEDSPTTPPSRKVPINRTAVGLIALGCLVASLGLFFFYPEDVMWRSGFTRIGLLMGAFWLALPTKKRDAAWASVSLQTFGAIALALVAFFLKVPVLMILGALSIWWVVQFILKPFPNRADGDKR